MRSLARWTTPKVPLARGQFRISEYSVDERVQPSVGMDAAGNFVVAWQGWGNDAYGWGINAQRYYANGTPMGGRFVVNSYQAGTRAVRAWPWRRAESS